jgi:hypothetical protein
VVLFALFLLILIQTHLLLHKLCLLHYVLNFLHTVCAFQEARSNWVALTKALQLIVDVNDTTKYDMMKQ